MNFHKRGFIEKAENMSLDKGKYVEMVICFPTKNHSVIKVKEEFSEGEDKVPLDNIAKRAEAYKPSMFK